MTQVLKQPVAGPQERMDAAKQEQARRLLPGIETQSPARCHRCRPDDRIARRQCIVAPEKEGVVVLTNS